MVVAIAVLAVAASAGLAAPAEAAGRSRAAVALGDSYASGEGLAPYQRGTDTATNQCHRSPRAYPELLTQGRHPALKRVRSVACSGAITGALVADLPDASDELPQLAALRRSTKTVTLTIGGNDIGFVPVLAACIYTPVPALQDVVQGRAGCRNRPGLDAAVTGATAGLAGAAPTAPGRLSIAQVLRLVHARAPKAKVYVTGYPRLFGLTGFAPNLGCQVGQLPVPGQPTAAPLFVSDPDVRWIRSKIDGLNAAIRSGVDQARAAGVRAHYVDVASDFTSHNVCGSGRPWLNGVVFTAGLTPSLATASFHPNARGQRAYADALSRAIKAHRYHS